MVLIRMVRLLAFGDSNLFDLVACLEFIGTHPGHIWVRSSITIAKCERRRFDQTHLFAASFVHPQMGFELSGRPLERSEEGIARKGCELRRALGLRRRFVFLSHDHQIARLGGHPVHRSGIEIAHHTLGIASRKAALGRVQFLHDVLMQLAVRDFQHIEGFPCHRLFLRCVIADVPTLISLASSNRRRTLFNVGRRYAFRRTTYEVRLRCDGQAPR